MLVIPCPWCGERSQSEFAYGGDATLTRPGGDEPFGERWMDYVYLRDNPRGAHLEYWYHHHGCHHWFKVLRDNPRGAHLEYWYHHHGCHHWFKVLRDTETSEIRASGPDLEHPGKGR